MRRNPFQIPETDLKTHQLSFPKIRIYVCTCICLNNFWKVIHKTKNKSNPLGENWEAGDS